MLEGVRCVGYYLSVEMERFQIVQTIVAQNQHLSERVRFGLTRGSDVGVG